MDNETKAKRPDRVGHNQKSFHSIQNSTVIANVESGEAADEHCIKQ
jgi:hypothetical protein